MIHFHGSPVSGEADSAWRFYQGRHVMVSFANPEHLPIVAEVCESFCLDNGAFSAWKSGKSLDVKAYADWVEQWYQHPAFAWCVIPDVIDGTQRDNRMSIDDWMTHLPSNNFRHHSVPVWHFHESTTYLAELAERFPLVALGSSGKWPTPGTESWWERVDEFMPAICDGKGRPRCKLHGLRMLNPEIFQALPLASADSTNAAVNAGSVGRFGQYPPLEAWARSCQIADRIEAYQSAAAWYKTERVERALFYEATVANSQSKKV